jgi:hypothetical protein
MNQHCDTLVQTKKFGLRSPINCRPDHQHFVERPKDVVSKCWVVTGINLTIAFIVTRAVGENMLYVM